MDQALVEGQFGPWRTVWLLGGLGALNLAASAKFVFVDRALAIAAYPAMGGLGFAVIAAIFWTRTGTFLITRATIAGRRRVGPPFQVPIADISHIETGSRKLPRLVISHKAGTERLDSISARDKSIDALRSLGVQLS